MNWLMVSGRKVVSLPFSHMHVCMLAQELKSKDQIFDVIIFFGDLFPKTMMLS